MRLGIALPQWGPHSDAMRISDFARTAEGFGYRSLWVGDRVLAPVKPTALYPGSGTPEKPYPAEFTSVLDPMVVLSAAAAATTSAVLGSSTLNATWHSPILLARALTSLDQMSDGRLIAGFGTGWLPDEYEAVGVSWQDRGARLDEILDFLDEYWTENPFEHHGKLFNVPPAHVDLRPVHPGGPPVMLGAFTPVGMRRVGVRGSGWLAVHGLPADYEDLLWQTALRAAERVGRDSNTIWRELRINPNPGQSVSEIADIAKRAGDRGYDGAFYDLTYVTRSVDESLELAAELINRR